eukprot:scaffold38736_cov17-Tisochrysis_lutea.AAC.4
MLTEPCMVVRSVHDLDVCWCVAHPLKCLLPAYRCLPYHLSNWTEMRQETLDAVPSLESQTYSDDSLPEYLLQGTFDFKAIRVYDGDTIWAAVIVRDQAWKIQCRLLGIDAPEMPSRCPHDENLGANHAVSVSTVFYFPHLGGIGGHTKLPQCRSYGLAWLQQR